MSAPKPHQQVVANRALTPFEQYLHRLLECELEQAREELQDMMAQIDLPDDDMDVYQGGEAMTPQHITQVNFCLDEYFRKQQQATKLVGIDSYEIIGCGQDETHNLGLHPSLRNQDDHDAVLPILNDFRSVSQVRAVSAGGTHSVAVTNTGCVYSWGNPDEETLGREYDESGRVNTAAIPGRVKGFVSASGVDEDSMICQTAAGESHTLFLSLSGTVYAVGFQRDSDDNKFHYSTKEQRIVRVDMPGVVRSIHVANAWSAALLQDGSVVTWGFGNSGELARSAEMTQPNQSGENGGYDVDPNRLYVKLRPTNDGGEDKVLDHEFINKYFLTPRPVQWAGPSIKRTVIAVGTGFRHLLVAARDHGSWHTKVYASGLNGNGQLGLGDVIPRHALTQVTDLDGDNITQLACGEHFSLALSMDGLSLYSFGRGDNGSLGIGIDEEENKTRPVRVHFPDLTRITRIEAGGSHCVAINDKREIYTWGSNTNFRTGHRRESDLRITLPRKLDLAPYCGPETGVCYVHDVSAGDNHTLFLVKRVR